MCPGGHCSHSATAASDVPNDASPAPPQQISDFASKKGPVLEDDIVAEDIPALAEAVDAELAVQQERAEARRAAKRASNATNSVSAKKPRGHPLIGSSECQLDGCTRLAVVKNKFCDDHRWFEKCREEDCAKVASFNVLGASPQFCGHHKRQGMINVCAEKKKCFCGRVQPNYGFIGAKATHCKQCKSEEMVDVKSVKCVTCRIKQPSFNYRGMKMAFCSDCKADGMINVRAFKCRCGKAIACWGPPGARAEWCSKCRSKDMVCNRIKTCACGRAAPSFGYAGSKPVCCRQCKTPDMIGLNYAKCRCATPRQPSFGFIGQRVVCCSSCREPGMLNVSRDMCACGSTIPSFGVPGGRPVCCSGCKGDGMELLYKTRCACNVQAYFGFEGERPTHCRTCRLTGMIDVLVQRCVHGNRLQYCRGELCGLKLGNRSWVELYCSASLYLLRGKGDVAEFMAGIDRTVRYERDDGRQAWIKPDLVVDEDVFLFDGNYWHQDVARDEIQTRIYLSSGFRRVIRARDDLVDIAGSVNIRVDAKDGEEACAKDVAQFFGVCDVEWPPLWAKARSLVARTVLAMQNSGAVSKQSSMHDFATSSLEA